MRPMLQEPSTRKMMSAAASLSHSSGFLRDGPKEKTTNRNKSSAFRASAHLCGRDEVFLEAYHNNVIC